MNYKKLHESAFVLDSHCDSPLKLYDGIDMSKKNEQGHFDFIRMKEGGVDASFFAIYTSNKIEPDAATRKALQLIARTYDAVEQNEDKVGVALSVEDALELKEKGLGAIFLGMENGLPIQKDLSLLRLFYDMGIRYMTLTHAGNNEICDSCATKEKKWNGLSPFGKKVVKEMNRLGMIIDVSHISDDSFYDVLKYSKKPVVATHSCCRAIADLPRNMTDQMIKDLAAKGGVISVTRDLAGLMSPYGICVNSISPGGFDKGELPQSFVEDYAAETPLGRMGRIGEDIKGPALLLASSAGDYITGHNLVVDGGFSIWK